MTTVTIDQRLFQPPPPTRQVFSNRTVNFRGIRAVGFDMDYTLIHYRIVTWEHRAYEHAKSRLLERRWPVDELEFDPGVGARGLVVDTERGNLVKADRFGYVKQACHGVQMLPFERQREVYSQELVDLRESRFVFMNTLFALSKACLYAQCVDLLDRGEISQPMGYADLYRAISGSVDEAHVMGRLKAEVVADPDLFIELDPDLPRALLDLRQAGKKLLLITNSAWGYTRDVMAWAFDRFLPPELPGWRELFDLVIVSARKPHFFLSDNPVFEVVDEEGLLRPVQGALHHGGFYHGGDAASVERLLGLGGSELLYVGDHIFADVNVTKSLLRWRTALIIRELEDELAALDDFRDRQSQLEALMTEKTRLEQAQARLRLQMQRLDRGIEGPVPGMTADKGRRQLHELRAELTRLDDQVSPLAKAAAELGSSRWGPIMRTGNDKSHLARQVERYADIYTSRVSNFGRLSPFAYLRPPRSSLPHDQA